MSIRLFGADLNFEQPWAFALLAVVAVVLVLEIRRERVRPASLLFSSLGLLPSRRGSWRTRSRWILVPIRLIGALCLVTALASPQVVQASLDVPAEGIDIVIALDTSSSMTSADFGGQVRMTAAKRAINDFVGTLQNDRAGIVIFAGEAMTLSPLTLDYAAAQRLVQPVEAGRTGLTDGTAIGTGLGTALNVLRPSTARSKVVVLATDGDNNTGDIEPIDAARLAKVLGVRVYTVGVAPTGRGAGDVNERLLRDMANLTGGTYNRASDEVGLRNIYHEIEALEKARVGSRGFIETNDASLPFVVAGTALLILEILLATTVFRRIP